MWVPMRLESNTKIMYLDDHPLATCQGDQHMSGIISLLVHASEWCHRSWPLSSSPSSWWNSTCIQHMGTQLPSMLVVSPNTLSQGNGAGPVIWLALSLCLIHMIHQFGFPNHISSAISLKYYLGGIYLHLRNAKWLNESGPDLLHQKMTQSLQAAIK